MADDFANCFVLAVVVLIGLVSVLVVLGLVVVVVLGLVVVVSMGDIALYCLFAP